MKRVVGGKTARCGVPVNTQRLQKDAETTKVSVCLVSQDVGQKVAEFIKNVLKIKNIHAGWLVSWLQLQRSRRNANLESKVRADI